MWCKIHDKIWDNPYMHNHAYLAVWIYLLTKASIYGNKQFIFNGKQMSLKPGQLITGAYQISKETGVPRGTVERILKTFKNEEQIEIQPTTKYSIITIVKWKKYQGGEELSEERVRNKRGTSEDNKDSKIDKNNISTSVSNETNDIVSSKELVYVSDLEEYKKPKRATRQKPENRKLSMKLIDHLKHIKKMTVPDGRFEEDNIYPCASLVNKMKATLLTEKKEQTDEEILKLFDYIMNKLSDWHWERATSIKYISNNYYRIYEEIKNNGK